MTSRFKISSKHDISTLTIHVLICWNKVTLFGQVVPMCVRFPEIYGDASRGGRRGEGGEGGRRRQFPDCTLESVILNTDVIP